MTKNNLLITSIATLFLFLSFVSNSQTVKKEPIELKGSLNQTVYVNQAGTQTGTGGFGVDYDWRYEGETSWRTVGKKGKLLAPVLYQYESSKKEYKRSKRLWNLGIPTGYAVAIGGLVMTGTGFMQDEFYYDEETQEEIPTKGRKGLIVGGIATMFAGCGIITYSFYMGKKRFENSVKEYNTQVAKDLGAKDPIRIDLGLANINSTSNFYQGFNQGVKVRLTF